MCFYRWALVVLLGLWSAVPALASPEMAWPTPDTLSRQVAHWQAHPQVQASVLGYSHQGRPIHLLSVGAESARHNVLWVCGQHGDEPDGVQACLSLMADVVKTLKEPLWQARWQHTRWHLVPLLNPDGRYHNTRKNAVGVNLNANWAYGWFEPVNPALRPALYAAQGGNYRGDAPFSEPETFALSQWISQQKPDLVVDYHTGVSGFSQGMVLYPFTKDDHNALTPEDAAFLHHLATETSGRLGVAGDSRDAVLPMQTHHVLPQLRQAMQKHIPEKYLSQALAQLPPAMQSPGSAIDWCWGVHRIPALGFEIYLPLDVHQPQAFAAFQKLYAEGYGQALQELLAYQLESTGL